MFQIDLKNKNVIVTGATNGIGRGIARQMALAGANVCGCATTDTDNGFSAEIAALGVKGLYVKCDVTVEDDLQKLVDATIKELGGIDILVSNAGRNMFTGAENCTEQNWLQDIDLNLKAHWRLAYIV